MTEHRAEVIIGNLLRTGVLVAAAVVFAAGILYLSQHHAETIRYGAFTGEPAGLRSIPAIVRAAAALDSRALIQFGLLLLILTPVLRVVFAAVAFALERDRMYVVVSLIVLAILLYSLLHAA
jgi:uncharacterized membrane protein